MSRNIKGIFYGVSMGPGDPELMTVKAVRILKEADVIAAARVMGKQETALEIAICAPVARLMVAITQGSTLPDMGSFGAMIKQPA